MLNSAGPRMGEAGLLRVIKNPRFKRSGKEKLEFLDWWYKKQPPVPQRACSGLTCSEVCSLLARAPLRARSWRGGSGLACSEAYSLRTGGPFITHSPGVLALHSWPPGPPVIEYYSGGGGRRRCCLHVRAPLH